MHLVRQAWDEVARVIASIHERIVSASLILHRLGSYPRQNSIHQALAEIGRVHKASLLLARVISCRASNSAARAKISSRLAYVSRR
jgi:TnpA family transposase